MSLELDCVVQHGTLTLELCQQRITAPAAAIVGPSGAGKSTLLEAIAGAIAPSRGVIRAGDRVLFDSSCGIDLPARDRPIGYVPQDDVRIGGDGTVRDMLVGAARTHAIVGDAHAAVDRDRLDRIVDILELAPAIDRPLAALAFGERRRAWIARELLSRQATTLLVDEPLVGLDAQRRPLLPSLTRIVRELGIQVIYITHNTREVQALAEWVLRLDRGRVLHAGPLS